MLQKVLHEAGVGPEGIEIEITESMIMSDTDPLLPRSLSCMASAFVWPWMILVLDTSLSYLRKFPIDTIKIDGSFVADISTSADDAEIVRTISQHGPDIE